MGKSSLARGFLLRLEGDWRGCVISCEAGVCWITQEGDPQDYFLEAGEKFAINRPGLVVAQGLTAAAVCLKGNSCLRNLTWVRRRFLAGGAGRSFSHLEVRKQFTKGTAGLSRPAHQEEKMKICHYNSNQAGVVVGDKVYPIGEALVGAGYVRSGYTMLEVIEALANRPAAMQCARDASQGGSSVRLSSGRTRRRCGARWAAPTARSSAKTISWPSSFSSPPPRLSVREIPSSSPRSRRTSTSSASSAR
ncbi:MAG: DUF2917 domain-containing protein [Deltaproteobacteria bacterium]|nr:DUF2917 domain-containing protein [Deltaproteobacteria bacterium]